jgi:hypothetical protein
VLSTAVGLGGGGTPTLGQRKGHRRRRSGRGGAVKTLGGLYGGGGVRSVRRQAVRSEALVRPGGRRCSGGERRR